MTVELSRIWQQLLETQPTNHRKVACRRYMWACMSFGDIVCVHMECVNCCWVTHCDWGPIWSLCLWSPSSHTVWSSVSCCCWRVGDSNIPSQHSAIIFPLAFKVTLAMNLDHFCFEIESHQEVSHLSLGLRNTEHELNTLPWNADLL